MIWTCDGMGNLWQFFGLPDPDAGGVTRVAEQTNAAPSQRLTNEPIQAPEPAVAELVEPETVQNPKNGMDCVHLMVSHFMTSPAMVYEC